MFSTLLSILNALKMSEICFNLDQSKILLSGYRLIIGMGFIHFLDDNPWFYHP